MKRKRNYGELVNKVIDESDIILFVLDARQLHESINKTLEDIIIEKGKKYLYVINKCDLVSKSQLPRLSIANSVKVSAEKHLGTMRLLRKIMELSHGKETVVGVIGYPNTGKSTLINALKGRHSAPTSSIAGYTRGLQKIRVSQKLLLVDTPGIISYKESQDFNLHMIGAVDVNKIRDPEASVTAMIESLNGKIEKHFDVNKNEDPYETLEEIAVKRNLLKRGGIPDTIRAAKEIIFLMQKGKIR
jgi:ribosome biogenesis GTPase A